MSLLETVIVPLLTTLILKVEGYKTSVSCALSRIGDISDLIIDKFPDANIIIQSDHGVVVNDSYRDTAFEELPKSYIDSYGKFFCCKGL